MNLKSIQKNSVILLIAIAGGFLGGNMRDTISTRSEVVRAKRYEVIGASGKVLSYWGPDSDPLIPGATPKGMLLVFLDPDGVRRAQIGGSVGDYAPQLLFYAKGTPSEDGRGRFPVEPRLNVGLGHTGDAFLTMRDDKGVRVLLGADSGDVSNTQEDDWRLAFISRTGAVAYLGTHGEGSGKSQALVSVRDDNGQAKTFPPDSKWEVDGLKR